MYRKITSRLGERPGTVARVADRARGERMRQLRRERGLSQEDVARELDVTAKTYGNWERGLGIHPKNARRVADYFGVDIGEILEPADDSAAADRLDRIEERLDEILRRLAGRPGAGSEAPPADEGGDVGGLRFAPPALPEPPPSSRDNPAARHRRATRRGVS